MTQLSYLLSLLISFFGLFIGLALAYIAPEELKLGKKYFILVQNFVLVAIVSVFVHFLSTNIFLTFVAFVLASIISFYRRLSTKAIYFFLGIVFFFSSGNQTAFLLEAVLIFFYGFPTGTLFAEKMTKKPKLQVVRKLFLNYSVFLLVSIVFYYTNSLL